MAEALAWPAGYLPVFADEGAPMVALLARLNAARERGQTPASDGVPIAYLRRILDAPDGRPGLLAPPTAGRASGAAAGLLDPLSERELEVLRLLAAGRANQQVADDLIVALDTAKKHVSHILHKLGVANRIQAVTRARELGLLD